MGELRNAEFGMHIEELKTAKRLGSVFAIRNLQSAIPGVAFLDGMTRPGSKGFFSARVSDTGTPGDAVVVRLGVRVRQ